MPQLQTVKYVRYEFHSDPEPCEGTLLTFIYDIPYFSGCGVLPPYHILNQILAGGGTTGGMSPGATWKPFTISREKYDELVVAVRNTPISKICSHARYAQVPMRVDPEFDHIQDRIEWLKAVCAKHRDRWHRELGRAGRPK